MWTLRVFIMFMSLAVLVGAISTAVYLCSMPPVTALSVLAVLDSRYADALVAATHSQAGHCRSSISMMPLLTRAELRRSHSYRCLSTVNH